MKKSLSREDAEAFKTRWAKVNARERADLRNMTLDEKLEQTLRLMHWVDVFGWDAQLAAEEDAGRANWRLLREKLLG